MNIDVFFIPDIKSNTGGIKKVKGNLGGKTCLKATLNIQGILSIGIPGKIKRKANELVKELSTPDGGFIYDVIKWYRPSYKDENINALIETFNKYRKK